MNTQQKPILLHLENVGGDEWALRYKCSDSALWNEIKETIMDQRRSDRRWDPDECNGRGAWVISECVLQDLRSYFPSIDAWIAKSTAGNTPTVNKSTRNIEECPF